MSVIVAATLEVPNGLQMWQLLWSLLLEHDDQADDAATEVTDVTVSCMGWALAAMAWGTLFVAAAEIASSRAADLLQDRRVLDRAVPREQQHLR